MAVEEVIAPTLQLLRDFGALLFYSSLLQSFTKLDACVQAPAVI